MIERFDDELLTEFAHTFYGYGDYNGRYWFIGMEEGGGNTFADVNQRLRIWKERGKHELEDLAAYHAAIGITSYFNEKPTLQRTWAKLIRILLSQEGSEPTTEQIREYQRSALGRSEGDTCLVELLPLPSPSTRQWLYSHHSQIDYLISRDSYQQTLLGFRISHLKQRIDEYKPGAVIFYGFGYRYYWQEVAGVRLTKESDGIYVGENGASLFTMLRHPAAKGVTNEYFRQVGTIISMKLAKAL